MPVCLGGVGQWLSSDRTGAVVTMLNHTDPANRLSYHCYAPATYLLTYAHRSQWSIGHQLPPAIALCSGLLLSFRTSWSPALSALLQCLASNCCEAGLSSSSPEGSRSGLSVWCWMLASWGCVRSSPTSSAVSAWPLVPVPLAPTVLHFGSSLAIGFCRCASDRCWRMSGSFVAPATLTVYLFVCSFVCLFCGVHVDGSIQCK